MSHVRSLLHVVELPAEGSGKETPPRLTAPGGSVTLPCNAMPGSVSSLPCGFRTGWRKPLPAFSIRGGLSGTDAPRPLRSLPGLKGGVSTKEF